LTYEKGAAFWSRRQKSRVQPADEEQERQMYELAIDRLTAAGYEHYEVSNFARSGHRCRHNLTYWTGGEYFAAGPGAARYMDGWREMNHRSTTSYLQRIESGRSPVAEREHLDPGDRAVERLIFHLRMLEGLDVANFERTTGFRLDALAGGRIDEFLRWGLLERTAGRLRLTRQGLLVSDSLWGYLLAES
jgi:oxygen-independent coproporphyrinogen-3 oxidase